MQDEVRSKWQRVTALMSYMENFHQKNVRFRKVNILIG